MDYIKKYVLPLLLSAGIFVLLLLLKTVPVSRLWKGFSVLYVPAKTEPQLVLKTLQDNGCNGVISYYNQQIPYVNEFLPVKANSNDPYLAGRNAYFFDKQSTVMIYYIPDEYNKNATKAVEMLIRDYNIDAGLDCKSSFPLVAPLICLIAALIFLCLSKNRLVYLISAVFPVIFIFTMPFYTNAASVCLLLYGIFLSEKVWARKGSIRFILTSPLIIAVFILSCTGAFYASFVSGFSFILSLSASVLLIYAFKNLTVFIDSKRRFNPVLMRPAGMLKIINSGSIKKMFISTGGIFVLLLLYISSANLFSISNAQDLSFPMPTRYNTQNGIPTMDDYVTWTWNAITLPYKSLNSSISAIPQEGETVNIKRFVNTENGVKEKEEVLYTFNDSFRKEVINAIDELKYPAIEKLMKNQESGFSVDYSYGTGESFSKASLIVLLTLILLPCLMAIFYLTGRKNYGDDI